MLSRIKHEQSFKMFNENDLPHELLLITRQKNKIKKYLQLFKAQIAKAIQSGGFLGSLLSKLAGTLMKVAIALAKHVLALLGITAAASAIDAGIQKNYLVLEQRH